ncbi:MAG: lipoyl synthase [Actinobacteria bacterium]|nr:lipoyl synthase [Actinomycetota bacterium]
MVLNVTTLHARWLGRVSYADADALQRGLHEHGADDHLLLLEHPHVYTLGTTSHLEHVLTPPADVGAELVRTDRGGDVTYHGPGQLVGYPIITLPEWRDGMRDVVAYVRELEQVLIATLAELGVTADRRERLTGVWVREEKIAAIGVKVARGRTRHGFALNVDPALAMFEHIVPCGIRDKGVTSLRQLLGADTPDMLTVVDTVTRNFAAHFGHTTVEHQHVTDFRHAERAYDTLSVPKTPGGEPIRLLGRLADAGVDVPVTDGSDGAAFRRPEWMRVRADLGTAYRETKRLMRTLELHTVCEEAGCPNIYECWADRTATFMILGERCTRACGFCLVDTRKPLPLDVAEPARVAEAVATLGLRHAVVTSVARDDLDDGGASGFATTVRAIRARTPATTIEVLIPDCKGDPGALDVIFAARPDVLNHNLETVARLQRAARPSAGYARSLALLARAKHAGLVTKSGLILGMGEEEPEVHAALVDLRAVGVDIVTMGQYLRPSAQHLPVVRWWHPDELAALGDFATALGFAHVEAGPLVRSSYHAKRAVDSASPEMAGTAAGA